MILHWLKAFHLIFIVAWFSGLFYLPRLFVYHSLSEDVISQDRFKIMEKKLYNIIMTPAMLLAVLAGGLLLFQKPFLFYQSWFDLKLALVGSLIVYHIYCGILIKKFKHNQNQHSHVFYRIFNEYPTVILVIVVILAMVKG